ncbi:MAG: hypothetical protein R8K22_00060 [Mariprofundaceae bacterium]
MMYAILVDGRDFVAGQSTDVGDCLEALLLAILKRHPDWRLTVGMYKQCILPVSLDGKVTELYVPHFTWLFWPALAKGKNLFLSPSSKLPWRKLACPSFCLAYDQKINATDSAWSECIDGLESLMGNNH